MKKLLLLALVAAPLVMSAQDAPKAEFESLTTNWTVTTDLPAATNGRQGTFANGKCYIQDKSTGTVVIIGENGKEGELSSGSNHVGITRDEAGNVIVNAAPSFPNPFVNITEGEGDDEHVVGWKGMLRVFPAGAGDPVDFEFDVPSSFANTRSDNMSKAYGDVLDGGGIFFIDNGATSILEVPFDDEGVVEDDIVAYPVADGSPALKSGANQSYADVFNNANDDMMILNYVRGDNPNIYEILGNGTLEGKTINTAAINNEAGEKVTGRTNLHGVTAFTLGGFDFLLVPTGPSVSTYADEFSIIQLTDDGYNYVCTSQATIPANSLNNSGTCNEWFEVEPAGDVTAHIYQYAPGNYVRKHTFRIKATVTGIDNVSTAKTVTAVKYYNAQGIESATPFDGFNIVVNVYNDGTRKASKLLK